jgi:hypothetical protein
VAKVALPLLLWALYAYNKRVEARKVQPRSDEVPFERDYERIEPEQRDVVHDAGTLILRWHEVVKLGLLAAVILIGIFAVKEPTVRMVLTITAVVLFVIIAWSYRRRASVRE